MTGFLNVKGMDYGYNVKIKCYFHLQIKNPIVAPGHKFS